MSQNQGPSVALRARYSELNPWPIRYTPEAFIAAQGLADAADKAALEVFKKQLEGFPPPERQFQMRMDLSRGGLEVWALGGPHLRLRITAVYRLLLHECAITHLELLRPKEARHEDRGQTKKVQPHPGA